MPEYRVDAKRLHGVLQGAESLRLSYPWPGRPQCIRLISVYWVKSTRSANHSAFVYCESFDVRELIHGDHRLEAVGGVGILYLL